MEERNVDIPDSRRITFRIGINLGDIIIEGDDIYGDGVNLAARLEGEADPGGICISSGAYQQVLGKIDLAFEDIGERVLKNISEPVRAYRWNNGNSAPQAQTATAPSPSPTDKPSIAVLPFDNLSNDPDQEYFSDGLVEDLITDISKISGLFVIARNSSFAFKGQAADVKEIANKLGVKHVVEGSVRKMGSKLRINAQLIDAASGGHIWAERYDGDLENIFEFQDDIRDQIVEALQVNLTPAEKSESQRHLTDSVEAYELFLRARTEFFKFIPESIAESAKLYERAINIDPNFAAAYANLSMVLQTSYSFVLPGSEDALEQAYHHAKKAVEIDPKLGLAHSRLGWVQCFMRHYDEAITSFEQALDLSPNDAEAYAYLSHVYNFLGEPERAIETVKIAFKFDPMLPPNVAFHWGEACFHARQYDEALEKLRECIDKAPGFFNARLILAAALSELGRAEDAASELQMVRNQLPDEIIRTLMQQLPYRSEVAHTRMISGVRNAGLPDAPPADAPLPLPDKPSIAVLPFDNMSGDPEQEYFADGIAEDLITALSRFRWFFVIARNSSFIYKGKAVDVKQVATELGVQYVIEGSVRKAGNRVRITAQLIDAATGRHIWAERYDRDLSDIFAVQDEITAAITGAVGPSFATAEEQRASRKPPENLDAWDLVMRANWHLWRINKADLGEAKRLFGEAIELDPNSSFAHSGLALAYVREAGASVADDFAGNRDKAYEAAQRAIELDEQDARAQLALAWVYHVKQDNDFARNACLKALQLNPNLADAEGTLGLISAHLGNYDEALLHIEQAVRLSPQDPSMQFWNLARVIAALVADRPEEYLAHAKRLTESAPNFIPGIRHFVAANANLGQLDQAKQAAERALKLVPSDTITSILASVPIVDSAARDRYIDGLRKAGYPE
jgi:adenylate cyclase